MFGMVNVLPRDFLPLNQARSRDMQVEGRSDHSLVSAADAAHGDVCSAQRRLLGLIAEIDRNGLWKGDGAHDMCHWLWMRYGLSNWKASRWLQAAHALESLPLIEDAFTSGRL